MNKSYILFLVVSLLLMFSCGEKDQQNKVWEDFKLSINEKEYDYLVENSFDSIKCIDCISNKLEKNHHSEYIYRNYLGKFYNKKLLNSKQYSVFKNDKIIRISYDFTNPLGDEAYNIIYMFDKKNDKFLLRGKIIVP